MAGKKHNPKLAFGMPFGEALERFVQTDPVEVERLIERSKAKKPPGNASARRFPQSKSPASRKR